MIVNYQIVGGSGWTPLFNEANNDACEKFAPSFRDQVQTSGGYGLASEALIPQSNTVGQVRFKWQSTYGTPDLAAASIRTLRASLKGKSVNLQAIVGATTLTFANAVCIASDHDQRGAACTHQLDFQTNDVS